MASPLSFENLCDHCLLLQLYSMTRAIWLNYYAFPPPTPSDLFSG